jgi:hypothetical protein
VNALEIFVLYLHEQRRTIKRIEGRSEQMKISSFCVVIAVSLVLVRAGSAAAEQQQQGPAAESDPVAQAVLIVEAIKIMNGNIQASGRESGEIDKLVRALSGISIKERV